MDKTKIFAELIVQLERNLQMLKTAALEAKDAATNEESKAENKYDTRGLEASYLAGAQARRAGELTQVIDQLNKVELSSYSEEDAIGMTSLITVEIDGEIEKHFFLLPFAGGEQLQVEDKEIMVITLDSPIGKLLNAKRVGDDFELKVKEKVTDYEVLSIL